MSALLKIYIVWKMGQKEILDLLKKTGRYLSVKQISQLLNQRDSTIQTAIQRLFKWGFVDFVEINELWISHDKQGKPYLKNIKIRYYKAK